MIFRDWGNYDKLLHKWKSHLTTVATEREIGVHLPDEIVVVEGSTPAKYLVFSRAR